MEHDFIINPKEMLNIARKNSFAIPAFNTNNLEFTQGIIEACKELNSFAMLQTSESSIKYAGSKPMSAITRKVAEEYNHPVALHLDHGKYFKTVVNCIRDGWSSIMIDASERPYNENVALTKKVVESAHNVGLQVEAEIGHVGGVEDYVKGQEFITEPKIAKKYYEDTKVDSLAVAIGNAHGIYSNPNPKLRIDVLEEVANKIDIPLVLHGGSGLPKTQFQNAIKKGIAKINIDTELRIAHKHGIKTYIEQNPEDYNPRNILKAGKLAIKEIAKEKIKWFKSQDSLSYL